VETVVLFFEGFDDGGEFGGVGGARSETVPDALLVDGLAAGKSVSLMPMAKRCSRYSVAPIAGTSEPEHSRMTSMYFGGNSFIITPPFSPSAIWVTSGGTCLPASSQRERLRAS